MSEFISWKAQPIFISSTFTDMMAERDALRDFVFPELAERLRARHIHLEPIDLRWGVETTDKKEQEEKELLVLKVCLDEIDRCKPFLIGLIGDRYGWVPPAGRMKAAENEKGFTSTLENKSITALEIEYGVLTKADQMLRSRFYFREPLEYDKMSPEKAKEFSDMHNPELDKVFAENRLRDYKAKIVAKVGKERVYHYKDTEDFKKEVLEQIWTELDAQTKELEDTRPKTWQQEEQLFLEEFIEDRTIAFSGREDVINHLVDFAKSPKSYEHCGICLTGESGSGKSALFAKLHKELQQENVFILAHAAGISLRSNSLENMLIIWLEELAEKLKIDIKDQLQTNNKFDDLTKLFAELLSQTSVDHRVIVLVDALNQFERTAHAKYVNWLPELLPKNVKFIFTAIPGEETDRLSSRTGIKVEELKTVTKEDAKEIITAICKRYRKSLNPEVIEILLCKKTDMDVPAYSNPLWLNMAVDEFLLLDEEDFAEMKVYEGTSEEKLNQLLLTTAREMPADIESMYAYLFDKTRQRFGKDFVNAFFNYIALTRNGLRESDLEILIKDYANQKWDVLNFAALRRYLRAHIVRKGEEGLWDFRHVQVRSGINKSKLASIEQKAILHRHIAAHLEKLPADDTLRMTEILWHLFKADEIKKAANIYGSSGIDTQQTIAHSKTILDIILEDERNVNWITNLTELKELDEDIKRIININFLFTLSSQLEDSVRIKEKKLIYLSILNSTQFLLSRNPNSAEYARDLSISYSKLGEIHSEEDNTQNAIACFESSLKIAEGLHRRNPDSARYTRDLILSYNNIANLNKLLGDTKTALTSFENSLKIAEELRTINPNSELYNHDLSLIYGGIGDINILLGDTTSAITWYERSLKFTDELVKKNPDSAEYVRDLSVTYERIGDINMAIGERKSALMNYESSMKIHEELLTRNPDSAVCARDLSVIYTKQGDINKLLGNTKSALMSYESSMKIAEELRKRNPDSSIYARDLSISFQRIGNINILFNDLKNALKCYESSLEIAEELRKRNPDSAEYARDLSVAFHKIGELYNLLGDAKKGLTCYESSLKITEELRKKNPDSAEYARDLSVDYERIGDINTAFGEVKSSLIYYENSLNIREELRKKNPGSIVYTRDLSVSYNKVGDIYLTLGNKKSALTNYESSLKIVEELLKRNPDSAEYARDLSVSYDRIGDIYLALDGTKSALTSYESSLKITEEWQKKNPDSAVYARDLVVCYFKLKRINDLKEALIYMINKNMHMDPQLVEVCRQLGIPIKMGASNLVEIIENEYTGDKRLEAADKCFQEQKWKEAEQLFLNLLMQNIVAKNLQYKIAVCILNGNEKLPDDQRNRVVNLIKQMKGLGKIIEADEIEQLLSKKNLD